MSDLDQPITAENIIKMAQALGLRIKVVEAKYFSKEQQCACPAGIATIMRDPHAARESFGSGKAIRVLGPTIAAGLSWGFDLSIKPKEETSDEFKAYAEIGCAVRLATEAS
jgi:hypothetical protein